MSFIHADASFHSTDIMGLFPCQQESRDSGGGLHEAVRSILERRLTRAPGKRQVMGMKVRLIDVSLEEKVSLFEQVWCPGSS
jgi:hypothetical protein